MVDLQLVGILVTATSVTIAAIYYMVNLRETIRNRRAAFASTVMQSFLSEEGALRWVDLLSMKWTDFDDFVKKYDSTVNRENFAKRMAFWNTCDSLGYQYRTGAIDLETVYNVGGIWLLASWYKFKPIIERYREWEWPTDRLANWEYLANAIEKLQKERDLNYERKRSAVISTHTDGIPQ
jgi:hypothetical protein